MGNLLLHNPDEYKHYFPGYKSGDIYGIYITVQNIYQEVGLVLRIPVDSDTIEMHLHLYEHCRGIKYIRSFLKHFKELLVAHIQSTDKTNVVTLCDPDDTKVRRLLNMLGFKVFDVCLGELQIGGATSE